MRVIINDKRYGALKTLGERKQAFNEVCFFQDIFCVFWCTFDAVHAHRVFLDCFIAHMLGFEMGKKLTTMV
jgi:FF domain